MWPKNSCALQLRVVVCVILLGAVRVINVFVPLLTKEISKFRRSFTQLLSKNTHFKVICVKSKKPGIHKYHRSLVNRLAGTGGKEVSFCWQLILIYVKWTFDFSLNISRNRCEIHGFRPQLPIV